MREIDIKKLLDTMSIALANERNKYHLTLGELIKHLETNCAEDQIIEIDYKENDYAFPNECMLIEPHSYRGYYSDLAFETAEARQTVRELLIVVKECLGREFAGWKGGLFKMNEDTPLWISWHGCSSGLAIIAVNINREANTATLVIKKIED